MKRTLSICSFIVAFAFLLLFIRSRGLDEDFEFGNEYQTMDGHRKEYFFALGWGPHGIRLFRRIEDENLRERYDERNAWLIARSLDGGTWGFRSDPYREGVSWGWPEKTIWNKCGFWLFDETYVWKDGLIRRISLIATPLWLPFVMFVALGCILIWRHVRVIRQAKQGVDPDA